MARVPSELLAKARRRSPLAAEELAMLVRGAVGEAAIEPRESALESLARVQGEIEPHLRALSAAVEALSRRVPEIPTLICAGHLEAAYVAGLAELSAVTVGESVELLDASGRRGSSEMVRWLLTLAQERWTAWKEGGRPRLESPAWWTYLAAVLQRRGRGLFITPEGSRSLGEEPPLVTAVELAEASQGGRTA